MRILGEDGLGRCGSEPVNPVSKDQWWNSERFVVITRQLQAAKCSLSFQLFRHILNLLDVDTVELNVNKCLLDLSALHCVHASRIFS
jgi:hypothetical protein